MDRAGWPRALLGLGALALTQALLTIPVGELAARYGFDPHAGLIRGWALGAPVALVWLLRRPAAPAAGVPAPAVSDRWAAANGEQVAGG